MIQIIMNREKKARYERWLYAGSEETHQRCLFLDSCYVISLSNSSTDTAGQC